MQQARNMEEEYHAISRYVEEHDGIPYPELDSDSVEKVNLFAIPDQKRFFALEERLDLIIAALPALKRIFAKPITRLKDVDAVLPVEAVRVIDHSTMRHVSVHSEFWCNVDGDTLTPRKLLTLAHEEEFKIYENIAFAQLITTILDDVKANITLCKNVIYSTRPLQFDLLQRTNHLMHYLALGKLHVGYAHAQDSYHHVYSRCLEKLIFIEKALHPCLRAPVYRICSREKGKLTLKKTNVFRLQKDYKQTFGLLKYYQSLHDVIEDETTEKIPLPNAFADYSTLLALFAAKHFNFNYDPKEPLHFRHLRTKCRYKDWCLTVERFVDCGVEALRFEMEKDKRYSCCFLFWEGEQTDGKTFGRFARKHPADEFLIAQHMLQGAEGSIYLNIYDIDSFRRIQQVLLRCMVLSDEKRQICPFCGADLKESASGWECEWCKTLIERQICETKKKEYFTLSLKDYSIIPKFDMVSQDVQTGEPTLKDRKTEAMLFYRNITEIDYRARAICPHCKMIH